MANNRLNLSREQLATFLKNHQQIKQFERLFVAAADLEPSTLQDIATVAETADAKVNSALAQLTRIANALEMLATAPVVQNNNSVVTDYIDLPEIGPHVSKERRVQWNRDDGTMGIGLYGGSVLRAGQGLMYYAKNTSGGLIAKGTPVMFTGTVGASGKLTVGPAVADGSVLSDYMMGVADQDIANNAFGYVTSFGLVRGFDTTGAPYGEVWANGDLLYFDPATPGTWTKVKPVAPAIDVPVAVVINADSGGSGSIFVRMTVAGALSRLQDVYVNGTPLAGQVLIYDATQQRWENHHLTAGANIEITNADGSITIAVTGLGTMAFQNTGASGSFTTADGKTVTVVNGIITGIA